jgi:CelD/BcsL family acetyltransferase involved in cellulose biosynthesis
MSAVAQRAAFRGPAPLDCEIVADPVALKRLAPQWWNLWRDNPSATPFQSPAWLLSWWEAFAPGDLATIAVWAGGNLVGLAPLYIERSGAGDRLLPVGIGLSDYFDVLCAAGCAEQVVGAIGDAAPAIDWSQWSLENLLPDALALGIHCGRAAAAQTAPQATCPVLALDGDESLTGCVPTRRRRQLRRAHAAAGRRGRVSIGRVEMEYGRFLDHLMRLHGARWAGEGGG